MLRDNELQFILGEFSQHEDDPYLQAEYGSYLSELNQRISRDQSEEVRIQVRQELRQEADRAADLRAGLVGEGPLDLTRAEALAVPEEQIEERAYIRGLQQRLVEARRPETEEERLEAQEEVAAMSPQELRQEEAARTATEILREQKTQFRRAQDTSGFTKDVLDQAEPIQDNFEVLDKRDAEFVGDVFGEANKEEVRMEVMRQVLKKRGFDEQELKNMGFEDLKVQAAGELGQNYQQQIDEVIQKRVDTERRRQIIQAVQGNKGLVQDLKETAEEDKARRFGEALAFDDERGDIQTRLQHQREGIISRVGRRGQQERTRLTGDVEQFEDAFMEAAAEQIQEQGQRTEVEERGLTLQEGIETHEPSERQALQNIIRRQVEQRTEEEFSEEREQQLQQFSTEELRETVGDLLSPVEGRSLSGEQVDTVVEAEQSRSEIREASLKELVREEAETAMGREFNEEELSRLNEMTVEELEQEIETNLQEQTGKKVSQEQVDELIETKSREIREEGLQDIQREERFLADTERLAEDNTDLFERAFASVLGDLSRFHEGASEFRTLRGPTGVERAFEEAQLRRGRRLRGAEMGDYETESGRALHRREAWTGQQRREFIEQQKESKVPETESVFEDNAANALFTSESEEEGLYKYDEFTALARDVASLKRLLEGVSKQ